MRIGQGEATSRQLSSPLPNWFIIWILFLILVILVVVILTLGVYICRTKRKSKPGLSNSNSVTSEEEVEEIDRDQTASQTPAQLSGSFHGSTTASRATISRGSSGNSRAMSVISSAGSERMSASSACLSSTIHLPYKPPTPSFSSLNHLPSKNSKLPQSPSSSSTFSTRVLDCRSPISAYQVSSPHTPTQEDQIVQPTPNSLLPEVKDLSLLQIHSREERDHQVVSEEPNHPIYSQAVPKYERQRLTPGERRRSSNKVAPLNFQTSQQQQQLQKHQQFIRNKVTSMASTESAYSSGSGEAEDLADDQLHHPGQRQDDGRELQQELRARIMASPYAAAWPRASIPRRVHKLTWEEEQMGQYNF